MSDELVQPDLTDEQLERAVGRLYLRYAALEVRLEAAELARTRAESMAAQIMAGLVGGGGVPAEATDGGS